MGAGHIDLGGGMLTWRAVSLPSQHLHTRSFSWLICPTARQAVVHALFISVIRTKWDCSHVWLNVSVFLEQGQGCFHPMRDFVFSCLSTNHTAGRSEHLGGLPVTVKRFYSFINNYKNFEGSHIQLSNLPVSCTSKWSVRSNRAAPLLRALTIQDVQLNVKIEYEQKSQDLKRILIFVKSVFCVWMRILYYLLWY